jgi:Xaa-Pro dipeptidase
MKREGQKARLEKIFRNLRGVDTIFISNSDIVDPNFLYLTGFTSGLFENSVLMATRRKLYLMTSPLEYQTALSQKTNMMQVIDSINGAKTAEKVIKREVKGRRVGINASFMSFDSYRSFRNKCKPGKIVDVSKQLLEARMIKSKDEIDKIRRAVRITKRTMKMIPKYFKEGMAEIELAARFDFIQKSLGASGNSFPTIVCFGKNAAMPHHFPDGTRLRKGDFILIDVGAKVKNYCSDITRTFIFGSAGTKQQREMIKIVRGAQREAINRIRPGRNGKQIHLLAEKYIDTAQGGKYKGKFIHGLGHSLGLEDHDGPAFSRHNNTLKQGMVVTVEPGIYINGFGGVRIEDDVLVTQHGCEIL